MKIVVTNDYRAVGLKLEVVKYLKTLGHSVIDVGSMELDVRDNYVERADAGVAAMKAQRADYGIFLCGSGTGITIRANKHAGVRAMLCLDERTAEYCRKINNANVLCLSGGWTEMDVAKAIIDRFMGTDFEESRRDRVEMLDVMP